MRLILKILKNLTSLKLIKTTDNSYTRLRYLVQFSYSFCSWQICAKWKNYLIAIKQKEIKN